jgi:hypothetical protein
MGLVVFVDICRKKLLLAMIPVMEVMFRKLLQKIGLHQNLQRLKSNRSSEV